MRGDAVEQEQLGGAGEQHGPDGGFEIAHGASAGVLDQQREREPAPDGSVVDGVGQRGLAGLEAGGVRRRRDEQGEGAGLGGERAAGGVAGVARRGGFGGALAWRWAAAWHGREGRDGAGLPGGVGLMIDGRAGFTRRAGQRGRR
ncbi:MAG: hypothetical protein R3B68_00600 [Phycisphaerales bacterium]